MPPAFCVYARVPNDTVRGSLNTPRLYELLKQPLIVQYLKTAALQ